MDGFTRCIYGGITMHRLMYVPEMSTVCDLYLATSSAVRLEGHALKLDTCRMCGSEGFKHQLSVDVISGRSLYVFPDDDGGVILMCDDAIRELIGDCDPTSYIRMTSCPDDIYRHAI